ncbi:protein DETOXIFICATION 17-like isoform X2 [Carica papaya]|uniref:protein DETOXIFICATION 17-like isoform X2 n=1 Tax=Carica papaya TaxID=3649 RepID=UPI000B8D04AC|nr:protein DETOXIFICATION 17-like isoform X2 [Carica papaya]
MKKVIRIAAPMVGFLLLMSVSPVISVMMVGHLDELSLSGASIATSFANVSGFAFLLAEEEPQPRRRTSGAAASEDPLAYRKNSRNHGTVRRRSR